MKKTINGLILVFILISVSKFSTYSQNYEIKYNYSINLADFSHYIVSDISIVTDHAGNLYAGGNFQDSNISFGNTKLINHNPNKQGGDFFLLKINSVGKIVWARNGNNSVFGGLRKLSFDNYGNLYLTGSFNQVTPEMRGIIALNFDQDGNQFFFTCSSANDIQPVSSIYDNHHQLYLYGYYGGDSLVFGNITLKNLENHSNNNIFIVKYDSNQNVKWLKIYPSNRTKYDYREFMGYHLTMDDSANIYISDEFNNDTMHFDSTTLYTKNNVYRFLTKINSNGNVIWAKSYGHSLTYCAGLTTDKTGNIFIVGNFCNQNTFFDSIVLTKEISQENQFYIFKINSQGKALWGLSSNSDSFCSIISAYKDDNNHLYVSGEYKGDSILFGGVKIKSDSQHHGFLTFIDEMGHPGPFYYLKSRQNIILCDEKNSNFYSYSDYGYSNSLGNYTYGHFLNRFSIETLSIPTLTDNYISIYPNPSQDGKFNLSNTNHNSKLSGYEVFDSYGRIIKSVKISPSDQQITIDLQNSHSGIYVVRVWDENSHFYNTKMMISR